MNDLRSESQPVVTSEKITSRIEFIKQSVIDEGDTFTGRKEQLNILFEKFRAIENSGESTILVYGESGIGKWHVNGIWCPRNSCFQ